MTPLPQNTVSHFSKTWVTPFFTTLMAKQNQKYSQGFKEAVVRQLNPGSRDFGFRASAKRFDVRGGPSLVSRWYAHRGDLAEKRTSHKPTILTAAERATYIGGYVDKANKSRKVVNDKHVTRNAQSRTHKKISRKRVTALGRADGIRYKRTKRTLQRDGEWLRNVVTCHEFVTASSVFPLCVSASDRNRDLQSRS